MLFKEENLSKVKVLFFNIHELSNLTADPIFNFQCQKELCNLTSPYLLLLCPCTMRTIFLRQYKN